MMDEITFRMCVTWVWVCVLQGLMPNCVGACFLCHRLAGKLLSPIVWFQVAPLQLIVSVIAPFRVLCQRPLPSALKAMAYMKLRRALCGLTEQGNNTPCNRGICTSVTARQLMDSLSFGSRCVDLGDNVSFSWSFLYALTHLSTY